MRRPLGLTGLWRNADFLKLWAGQTISVFGTLMGAIPFTAILVLNATPFQMSLIRAAAVAPGLVFALLAGVWIDRLPRRPILVGADIGRAALLGSIPVVFFLGRLRIEYLYVVVLLTGVLTVFFDVAYRAYLPALVPRKDLIEANSKLSASESVVEVSAFSLSGWIVQLFGAITSVVIDAFTYLMSALFLLRIRRMEPDLTPASERPNMRKEISEGIKIVLSYPLLRAIAGGTAGRGLGRGMIGAVILLFAIRELGMPIGVLTMIFALGGVSAAVGATVAGKVTLRIGSGKSLVYGFLIVSMSGLFIPLAQGPLIIAGAMLAAEQLVGGAPGVISEISERSLIQGYTPDRWLGRVNGGMRFIELGSILIGSLLAGALGETIGLRFTILVGVCCMLAGGSWLALSPVRSLEKPPVPFEGPPAPSGGC